MIAAIGIGTNLGDRLENMRHAIQRLTELGKVTSVSGVYQTAPWGVEDQPEFYNAALLLDVDLPPLDLLAALKKIETEVGREVTYRWGPRVIDLDILYYGELRVSEPNLTIPHLSMNDRLFVIAPLTELNKDYLPLLSAANLQGQDVTRIADSDAIYSI